ncbi:IS66 family insertion sequence element accessory protein TnpB [Acidithiobacillus ferridurans]|uniref:IS66 family insertion sequence element accessory protein TnpA n=1 Tax=Acidithiobacillus ferridurans TaxID=1232575 RepID=UPI001C06ECF9|nr:IS66 family insertion sequence element accessory protein TnpB [Acidithiobacillus ferridurans]MBU2804216.1 IS66 family insertion sequence element accessory protein TnpB [Acidithiobacillus ferridurans]
MTKEEKREMWRQRVEDCQGSGLSITAYCAREGIAIPSLYYWRKRFADREASPAEEMQSTGFLPVTLSPLRISSSSVEVQLLSGRSLKFSAPIDVQWLHTLVQVLERPCG